MSLRGQGRQQSEHPQGETSRAFSFVRNTIDAKCFAWQSGSMESNWAADHLQVIRTLMERSSVYRRALAPVMIYNGCLGLAAAGLGLLLRVFSPQGFISFWAGVALLGLIGSLLLIRRQSMRDNEPFWSPPTRRVTQALLPPIAAGFILSV